MDGYMRWIEGTTYLQFDHLNVKLAIIQSLAFEAHLLEVKYHDFDEINHPFSFHRQDRLRYYEELEIPISLAAYVSELIVKQDNAIYRDIDSHDEQTDVFMINDISIREIVQFPQLKRIQFTDMTTQGNTIAKKLKPFHIEVTYTKKQASKHQIRIPAFLSIMILILASVLSSIVFTKLHATTFIKVSDKTKRDTQKENVKELQNSEEEPRMSEDYTFDLNHTYTYIKTTQGQHLLYDKANDTRIDLSSYAYIEVAFLYDGENVMDESALLVSQDKVSWFMIRDDYQHPQPIIVGSDIEVSSMGLINISKEEPFYFNLINNYNMFKEGIE